MFDAFLERYAYWLTTLLLVLGLYGMVGKRNLVKKLIGMNILQSAVILFFIANSVKRGATVPILPETHDVAVNPDLYMNPLPHVLMLTAIVVSVATTGVALSFLVTMYRRFRSLDERHILEEMQ